MSDPITAASAAHHLDRLEERLAALQEEVQRLWVEIQRIRADPSVERDQLTVPNE
jgi:hypothetical protein